MEFISERTACTMISETVVKAGVSLFNAVKYIYMIADKDFYNINIKDIFKIALNNISDTTCLYNTGIKLDKERCAEMNTPEYERVLSLMVYSFAVRLPVLKIHSSSILISWEKRCIVNGGSTWIMRIMRSAKSRRSLPGSMLESL